MRKLLIFICTLVLMVSVFVVTATAETTYSDLRGVWKFNDTLSFPYEDWAVLSQETILFTDGNGDAYTRMFVDEDDYTVKYADVMTDSIISVYAIMPHEWHDSAYQTITITDGQASEAFKEWLSSNATEQFCDGSTCPEGDANTDGYCDDCGAKMRTLGEATQTAPYPSYLPEKSFTSNHHDVVAKINGEIYYIVALSEDCLFYGKDGNNLYHDSHQYIYYKLVDGAWDYDKANISTTLVCHQTDIIWTNRNIYFENGDPFFPVPLWAMVEKITQGGMETEIPKIHSSMASLAVFGIGLLALLIGLVLLPKVLRRFL